jgi:hypothetical protein
MMAEDATPLVEALLVIIEAARAYLPPNGIGKDAFIARVAASPPPSRSFGPLQAPLPPTICGSA